MHRQIDSFLMWLSNDVNQLSKDDYRIVNSDNYYDYTHMHICTHLFVFSVIQ